MRSEAQIRAHRVHDEKRASLRYALRLTPAETAMAEQIAHEGETIPGLMRRLLADEWARIAKPGRRGQ